LEKRGEGRFSNKCAFNYETVNNNLCSPWNADSTSVMSPIYMKKQCQYGAHIAMIFFGSGISFFLRRVHVFTLSDYSACFLRKLAPLPQLLLEFHKKRR